MAKRNQGGDPFTFWLVALLFMLTIGRDKSVHLTKGSNETRFDTRSRLGRELNIKIDAAESALNEIGSNIVNVRDSVSQSLPNWRSEFDRWVKYRSARLGWNQAMIAFVISVVLFYAVSIFYIAEFLLVQSLLIWNPFPNLLVGPLFAAVLVSYAVFGASLALHRQRLPNFLDGPKSDVWYSLEAKWSSRTDVNRFFMPESAHTESGRKEVAEHTIADSSAWYDVLGVSPAASPEQIKAAYREAMKSYHSDRVAGLGQKLRNLAEEESKRINVAYDMAKSLRGFR